MTENNNPRSIVVQFLQMLRDCLHRNQTRTFDVANGVLLRFSDIDHSKRNAVFQKAVHFPRGYLNWQ